MAEVKDRGAFLTRHVAGHDLLFVCDLAGQIRAFFNRCPHRSAPLQPEIRGRVDRWICPYHGWAFDLTGGLVAFTPAHDSDDHKAYVDRLNPDGRLDLVPVPHLLAWRDDYFVHFGPKPNRPPDLEAGIEDGT